MGKQRRTPRKPQPPSSLAFQIDYTDLEQFRLTLPDYRRFETYRFFFMEWDVVVAQYILAKQPRPQQNLSVVDAAQYYGFPRGNKVDVQLSGFVKVDVDTAMDADLDRPLILAQVLLPKKPEPSTTLLDGLTRLYKASRLELEMLPCYILTPEEEILCRI